MEYFWIIPVISIAVWILSNLIRPENPPRRETPRPRRWPDGEPRSEPASRPVSEVDRFLEEINNLRKKPAEEPTAAIPEKPRPVPQPVVRTEPPPRPRPRVPRRPAIEVVLPPSVPLSAPPARIIPVLEVLDVLPASAPAAALTPLTIAAPRPSPAVTQLSALLRSPQSMRTAILLQSVLGPPRCRKHRS